MKRFALPLLAALVVAACSNGSDGNSEAPSGTVALLTVEVPAKNFNGTAAITKPASQVFIAERILNLPAIYASDHEVTQGEYEIYCMYGGDAPSNTYGKGARYPAYYVSWYDAIVYCNLRSAADGLTPCYKLGSSIDTKNWTGIVSEGGKYCGPADSAETSVLNAWNSITFDTTANGWRLPTEAEWEMLARGGNLAASEGQTTYSGSDTIGDVAWYDENSGDNGTSINKKSHEVKAKAKNALNLYDMSGNVWEWCWDFSNTIDSNTIWTGPAANLDRYRVSRGGAWYVIGGCSTVANRGQCPPTLRRNYYGFRVVRNVQ